MPTRWKRPWAGKDWGQEEKGALEDEMVDGIFDSMDTSLSKLWETVDREGWRAAVHGVSKIRHNWVNDSKVSASLSLFLSFPPTFSFSLYSAQQ